MSDWLRTFGMVLTAAAIIAAIGATFWGLITLGHMAAGVPGAVIGGVIALAAVVATLGKLQ